MEIGRIRLEESFYLHPWTNPRTLSDGSSATALSENFFLNMGEWIRFILDHEFTHTIYYHRYLNETIGQYEDRINSYAIENMLNYRLNCSQLSYLDDDLNRKIIYPSEDFGIESNKEYSIICEENTRQNVEAFAFTPSCVTAKIENESLPNEPQEPNGDLNLTNNLTRYNSNITNTDNSSDEETLSQDLAPADTNYSESLKGYTNSKSQEDNGSIIDTKQQKENLIIKIVNWFKRLFR
jgi:hypothetical protein